MEFLSCASDGLFSEAGLGLWGPECKFAGSCECDTKTTGWIRRHADGHSDRSWFAELECELHGLLYVQGGDVQKVIELILRVQNSGL
jgi:hypothetical protein